MSGPVWVGLDGEERDLARLEHLIHEAAEVIGRAPAFASTHVVTHGGRHAAAALSFAMLRPPERDLLAAWAVARDVGVIIDDAGSFLAGGPVARRAGASVAIARLRDRTDGRAVRFPGQDQVPSSVTPARLIALSAIDRVIALGARIMPADLIENADHLRPRFEEGLLVLHVTALRSGRFRPFELATSHACCADGEVAAEAAAGR